MSKRITKPKKATRKIEKPVATLVCPKCGTYWARMRFAYGSIVKAADIDVLVGPRKRLANGEELACSSCKYQYTNYDIMLAIADGKTKLQPGEKIPVPADQPEHFDEDGVEIPNGAEEATRVVEIEEKLGAGWKEPA